ncbi:MAG: valine--tRNA ligase [bacterium]|nr:valine--tRNA ligase [bacterium]
MDSRYNHLAFEDQIYALWSEADAFNPDTVVVQRSDSPAPTKKPFSIIMPPPNANDPLHIGHAMFVSLEDLLIRYHRMLGDDTLWLPGTDHAGIETQFVFEKKLKKQGKSRFNFDRETLYQMIWEYVQENSDVAVNQMKKMGASADWSRFQFTLNPPIVETVLDTFVSLHNKGLVYRNLQLVNYCPHCGTSYSDLEVNHVEKNSPFYYLQYGPFVIGTVRPETKFRDTALAVNPNDPRYQKYIGETLQIAGLLGPITMTIIADEEVDPDFGTGIMKVTPAHDPHDFELGKKYNLPVSPIIDFNGRMDFSWFLENPPTTSDGREALYLERATTYHGKKVAQARELMVKDLETDGLLVKVNTEYTNSVGTCYRCGNVLEPLPLSQFFISVKPLVKPVLAALKNGEVKIHGAGHDKILKHWLNNLRDWNISRQIVWGIRLPVWYDVEADTEIEVSFIYRGTRIKAPIGELLHPADSTLRSIEAVPGIEAPDSTPLVTQAFTLSEITAGLQKVRAPQGATPLVSKVSPSDHHLQETDTFDTWFSSGQWPYATLKNSGQNDFYRYYPTTVMETGYDILPFWVMRMLLLCLDSTGKSPFTNVYLHGLVRDSKGQKMSKSKGNVVNPLEIIEKYGADALRMALVIRSSPGLDKSVGDPDFRAMRNFTNKIWNATRYVIQLSEAGKATDASSRPVSENAEFDQKLTTVTQEITQQLDNLKLGLAAETAYNEFWHWYCDEAIEEAKNDKITAAQLLKGLVTFLTLLHPFVPFVTEAAWQELRKSNPELSPLLITTAWPQA